MNSAQAEHTANRILADYFMEMATELGNRNLSYKDVMNKAADNLKKEIVKVLMEEK